MFKSFLQSIYINAYVFAIMFIMAPLYMILAGVVAR